MVLTFQLRIDFSPGKIPGQLQATLRYFTLDGVQVGDSAVISAAPGQSITIRPLSTSVVAQAQVGATPTDPPDLVMTPAAGPPPGRRA